MGEMSARKARGFSGRRGRDKGKQREIENLSACTKRGHTKDDSIQHNHSYKRERGGEKMEGRDAKRESESMYCNTLARPG